MPTPPHRYRIQVEDVGDVSIVAFTDKRILSEEEIQEVGNDLYRLVDERGRRKVLLTFGNVEFMSSAALGKLITLHRKLQAVQGGLVLCGISRDIMDVFRIPGISRLFQIDAGADQLDPDEVIRRTFGNPFRSAVFDPNWQTDTVLALAGQMEESDEFSAMPILADALQDAGCDNTDILNHCRFGSSPIRHRWILDVVLSKV